MSLFCVLFRGCKKGHKKYYIATTVKILFDRKGKASKTTPGSVEIEIYSNGVRKRYSTGVRVTKDQWSQWRVHNHPAAAELNRKIQQMYDDYIKLTSDPDFSIERMTNPNKMPSLDFLDWMEA